MLRRRCAVVSSAALVGWATSASILDPSPQFVRHSSTRGLSCAQGATSAARAKPPSRMRCRTVPGFCHITPTCAGRSHEPQRPDPSVGPPSRSPRRRAAIIPTLAHRIELLRNSRSFASQLHRIPDPASRSRTTRRSHSCALPCTPALRQRKRCQHHRPSWCIGCSGRSSCASPTHLRQRHRLFEPALYLASSEASRARASRVPTLSPSGCRKAIANASARSFYTGNTLSPPVSCC